MQDSEKKHRSNATELTIIKECLVEELLCEQPDFDKYKSQLLRLLKSTDQNDDESYFVNEYIKSIFLDLGEFLPNTEIFSALKAKSFSGSITKTVVNIYQKKGEYLEFIPTHKAGENDHSNKYGSLVAQVESAGSIYYKSNDYSDMFSIDNNKNICINKTTNISIKTEFDEIKIETVTKPEWAYGIGCDPKGLFVQIKEKEKIRKAYWQVEVERQRMIEDAYDYAFAPVGPYSSNGYWWDEQQRDGFVKSRKEYDIDGDMVENWKAYANNSFNVRSPRYAKKNWRRWFWDICGCRYNGN